MPPGPARRAKPLDWSRRARAAYEATLEHIAQDDAFTAQLVKDRVERALIQIAEFPGIGSAGLPRGARRFPVPGTGHVINYLVKRSNILIQAWYRARQRKQR